MRYFLSFLIGGLLFFPSIAASDSPTRDLNKVVVGGKSLNIGTYHLLAIGIDNYQNADLNLQTAVAGAQELQNVLMEHYTFDKGHSKLLLDSQATENGIIQALRKLAKEVGPNDSVLIYYAGHGHLDDLTKTGSWIPWDATRQTPGNWVSNEEIKGLLKAMKARHVLLISDSCFSGDFFRSQRLFSPQITDPGVRKTFSKISRRAMTAGGLEPVTDGGRDGQSIYTWWLLTALRESTSPYVLPEHIHDRLKKAVSLNASQRPMYGLLHEAGGEPDASFVFFRRGAVSLDAALREKQKQIQELEVLDKQAANELRKQQAEIYAKQAQMEDLDKQLADLQKKVGVSGGQNDLDAILVLLTKKKRRAKEIETLQKKAEAELKAKQAVLAEARRKQHEENRVLFEADYAKFKTISNDSYASEDLKAQAWEILSNRWDISDEISMRSRLHYYEGDIIIPTVLFEEDFSDNSKMWPVKSTQEANYQVLGGKFLFHTKSDSVAYAPNRFVSGFTSYIGFRIDVIARHLSGIDNNGFGIAWGVSTSDGFRFLISSNGQFTYLHHTNNKLTTILGWTKSKHIRKGNAFNALRVEKKGPTLTFYINGAEVGKAPFKPFSHHTVGFSVNHKQAIQFDDLVVTKLSK